MFTMIKFVWKKAIDCKAVLISSFFCILISNFLSLVIMFVTGAIFDTLYSGKEIDLLVKFCVLYTVTFIGSIVFSFLGNLLTAKANNQIMYKINRDVLPASMNGIGECFTNHITRTDPTAIVFSDELF